MRLSHTPVRPYRHTSNLTANTKKTVFFLQWLSLISFACFVPPKDTYMGAIFYVDTYTLKSNTSNYSHSMSKTASKNADEREMHDSYCDVQWKGQGLGQTYFLCVFVSKVLKWRIIWVENS